MGVVKIGKMNEPKTTFHERRYVGLYGSAKSWLIAEIQRRHPWIVVICKNPKVREEIVADLKFFLHKTHILPFPAWETIPFENVSPQIDISCERLGALHQLAGGKPPIIVASADAVSQRVLPKESIQQLCFTLKTGDLFERHTLLDSFELSGYQKVSLVEAVGEIAVHGRVIDFYPPLSPHPLRLEFEGNAISQIRSFDQNTQRSLEELVTTEVLPVRESVPLARHAAFRARLADAVERLKSRGRELETPTREIAAIISAVKTGTPFPGMELMNAITLAPLSTFFDYLPPETLLIIDDYIGIQQALDSSWENIQARESRLKKEHYLIPTKEELFLSPQEIQEKLKAFRRHYLDHLELLEEEPTQGVETITIRSKANTELTTKLKSKVGTGQALQPLAEFLDTNRRKDMAIAFVVGSQGRAERLHKHLLNLNFDAHCLSLSGAEWLNSPHRYPLVVLQGHLSAGFQLPDQKLIFISENEIFAERSYRQSTHPKTSLKRLMGSLAQLLEGDYVVHSDFGIGLYQGLRHLEVEGIVSDFLHIDYADSRLYLPIHNIGKIQKFVAAEGRTPALDKLGSNKWLKTKQKVKEAVATLAGDLIRLYATRKLVKGWRFDPAGAEDERFAEEFPYNETPDQLAAIQDTLKDMASAKPMDRLVCGDVGFGKTEVALRAAFKCIQHARQVAILVPTTILAEQHKQTFLNRFAGWPVKIGAVSRFYSAQDNKNTLAQLASGELDIVIGTHRLLSRDVVFKDLGLLIIDEEHRFGVRQKEKLKALKKQVDVLILTATPIPRTLHMSLLGIRDISVINTPPLDRRLIRTYIAAYDPTLIRDAILRELQRGGQCFYVHNKVQSIDLVAAQLAQIVPEARLRFAHGQMSETQLEKIMRQFLNKEIDVLVSTTIVESGLDIPNANTIIVDRADTFGLAQLYQLRGRVGRSARQAYAYFLIPKLRKLGAEAQKRLKALQALDDLGMGFNLALRDMEIRGAGNLLGREQSGMVTAVGFELYTKILKEAILNLRGQKLDLRETVDPELKLGVNCYIPADYIPDISERLVLYQRFAAIDSSEEIELLLEEVRDRFGPIGRETRNLAELMRLRCMLRDSGVVRAEFANSKLLLAFTPAAPIDAGKIMKLVESDGKRFKFGKNLTLSMVTELKMINSPAELYEPIKLLLERIAAPPKPVSDAVSAANPLDETALRATPSTQRRPD